MNIFIYSFSYDENSGGIIALHRLCHVINSETEHKAYLVSNNYPFSLWRRFRYKVKNKQLLKTNHGWNTPVWNKNDFPKDSVVIYPEIINGNPLGIKKVVRWFLHNPGHFTNQIEYGSEELYFQYHSGFNNYKPTNDSIISKNILNVGYYPIDIYTYNTDIIKDNETCYIYRKGKDKPKVHKDDAICLDGLSHNDTAQIMKRSKTFISYDPYTAYSRFAVLSGCHSIVVPDDGVSIEEWLPSEKDRYGVSYGFSNKQTEWAQNTKPLLFEALEQKDKITVDNIKLCLNDIDSFFNK